MVGARTPHGKGGETWPSVVVNAPEGLRTTIPRSKGDQEGVGASIWKMQEQSRHESLDVPSGYVRSTRLFEDHAGKDFA